MMWGYDIPDDADPIRWFKLLLLKDEDLGPELCASEFILRGKRMLRDSGKTAIALVADFLRALFNHTMYTITKARGKEVVDAMRLHIVITVPAIWKGYARQAMETAAEQAGILYSRVAGETRLTLAPEPEAAALSTLSEPGRKVGKNDVYIICDAGGGTVVSVNSPRCFDYWPRLCLMYLIIIRISLATKSIRPNPYRCKKQWKEQVTPFI